MVRMECGMKDEKGGSHGKTKGDGERVGLGRA